MVLEDPIEALYVKSALGLPDGMEKPSIADCKVNKSGQGSWAYEITASDPDADIIGCNISMSDPQLVQKSGGPWWNPLYFDPDTNTFKGMLQTEPYIKSPFVLVFTLVDAAGNSASISRYVQEEPEPTITPVKTATPPPKDAPSPTGIPADDGSPAAGNDSVSASNSPDRKDAEGRAFPVGAPQSGESGETGSNKADNTMLLIAGNVIALLCLATGNYLNIKRKNRKRELMERGHKPD